MLDAETSKWLTQNPHLWVPPALLALFFVGLGIARLLRKGEAPEELPEEPAPEEAPAPAVEEAAEPAAEPGPAPAAEPEAKPEPVPEAPATPQAAPEPAPAPAPAEEAPEEPATIATGMAKTRKGLLGRLSGLFSRGAIDEDLYEELEEILITSDVGPRTTMTLLENLRARASKEKLNSGEDLRQALKDEILKIMQKAEHGPKIPESERPWVVMVTGVNGAGKTTTIGKLARMYQDEGYKVLLGAADTFRAAATEQLEAWAERVGADIVKGRPESDPGAVAFDSIKAGVSRGADIVLIDTAGRLHTKQGLMAELGKVRRVMDKAHAGAPHATWLVIDGNTGQNAATQVQQFGEALELTGLVVTKLDGTAKGGALVGIVDQFELPVWYAGVGERLGDIIAFDAKAFVDALFEGE